MTSTAKTAIMALKSEVQKVDVDIKVYTERLKQLKQLKTAKEAKILEIMDRHNISAVSVGYTEDVVKKVECKRRQRKTKAEKMRDCEDVLIQMGIPVDPEVMKEMFDAMRGEQYVKTAVVMKS
jgi:hypothetical protein